MTEEIKDQNEETNEETVETQDKEKMLPQSEVNRLLAQEKRKAQQKLDALTQELDSYRTKEQEQETKIKEKVDAEKKKYPEPLLKLLEKLTPSEQWEWMQENPAEPKKKIPQTPQGNEDEGEVKQKPLGTIF